ncbi:hypothetical protein Ancab_008202, partial [Ancistrocladus abbreviatus]
EFNEGSISTQIEDVVDRQGLETTVSAVSSGTNSIPKQSLNWVPKTMSARRVHSPVRVNACPMGTQTVNGETSVAPQISAGKCEDHSAAFGGGGIKT